MQKHFHNPNPNVKANAEKEYIIAKLVYTWSPWSRTSPGSRATRPGSFLTDLKMPELSDVNPSPSRIGEIHNAEQTALEPSYGTGVPSIFQCL